MDETDFSGLPDVLEPSESDFYGKSDSFSHEGLAMTAYRKSLDALAQELTVGFWETKTDKYGNILRTYKPDGRLAFINCVRALLVVMGSDLDATAKTNIEKLKEDINNHYTIMCAAEHKSYIAKSFSVRQSIVHVEGKLNQDLVYYQHHINFMLEKYIKIFEEIELLLKRTKYFRKELNVA